MKPTTLNDSLLSRRAFLFVGGFVPVSALLAGCGGGSGSAQSSRTSRAFGTYTVTPVTPTTGTFEAVDISETGVVAGLHTLSPANGRAFPQEAVLYENGTFRTVAPVNANTEGVSALNNRGGVVGMSVSPTNYLDRTPLVYVDGQLISGSDPRFSDGVSRIGQTIGINDRGDLLVATSTDLSPPNARPSDEVFRFGASVLQVGSVGKASFTPVAIMPPANTNLYPVGINASGTVVGNKQNASGLLEERAVVWKDGTITMLPTLAPGQMTQATCIGDDGTVGGQATSAQAHDSYEADTAVLWPANGGNPTVLPGPSERILKVTDVNANGVAIGVALTYAQAHPRSVTPSNTPSQELAQESVPLIWKNGEYRDINELLKPNSGWYIRGLSRITNSGLILAYGSPQDNRSANSIACILTPQ